MKKIIKSLMIICLIGIFSFIITKHYYENNKVKLYNDKLNCVLKYKGLKEAKDFVLDREGNYYIAFKDKIQFIDVKGKSYDILKKENLNITSLAYRDKHLYFTSNNELYSYDIEKNKEKVLINNLPNMGDYNKSLIIIKKDHLYLTIGAATNSAVVGKDNKWLSSSPFFSDVSPYSLTLNGKNFGPKGTGAFSTYGTKSVRGQRVAEHFPGNSSIIIYNLKKGQMETYAWGIRNFKGIDFNSKGKLLVSVGGMEFRGDRPIKGDRDYIYEINKGTWYGWPDYSGGDPINSPRFKGKDNKPVSFVLDKHPYTNPPAPLYQHKTLNSIGTIAIDYTGDIFSKDSIIFYEKNEKALYSLDDLGIIKKEAEFEKANIESIKVINKKLIILDNNRGYLYIINKGN
ncbi:glucose / Sorbosone dehydrogenase family protein [Clostridium sporogenes]|uniref:Glucose / Sorbosone dehydrogenase family protein n=1 Tax=Clostridium sporogenes TaxID=1509 RepID=A0A1L3NK81_CLOSG|nr:PQQ-dependent sugar dehydrogenase [Clostridium sporogenes]APH16530.1 glucose / Sorbosone dehydrogenase family protein [Clostridium sporogenes]